MTAETSPDIAALAARGLDEPGDLSCDEIRSVCASALRQAEAEEPNPHYVLPATLTDLLDAADVVAGYPDDNASDANIGRAFMVFRHEVRAIIQRAQPLDLQPKEG